MIDEEVEIALREIRERVVSQPLAAQRTGAAANENGGVPQVVAGHGRSQEAIARLNGHLTTTARAWDRLPPVFSNRTGTAARFERWVKARLKTITRWFTWEQVNFNAAVHHALGEALQILSEQNATIAALEARLAEQETLRAELEIQRDDIHSLRAQIQADMAAKHIELQNQQREINSLRAEARGELEALRIELADRLQTQQRELDARANGLAEEIRNLENDQRVCFKQLSLEVNEYAVSLERARRQAGGIIEELEQKVRHLEAAKTTPSKP